MKGYKKKINWFNRGEELIWLKEEKEEGIMSQEIIDECLYLID